MGFFKKTAQYIVLALGITITTALSANAMPTVTIATARVDDTRQSVLQEVEKNKQKRFVLTYENGDDVIIQDSFGNKKVASFLRLDDAEEIREKIIEEAKKNGKIVKIGILYMDFNPEQNIVETRKIK